MFRKGSGVSGKEERTTLRLEKFINGKDKKAKDGVIKKA